MKKIYLAPQTEAIKLLGENTIMAGSGTVEPNWVLDNDKNIAI